MENIKVQVFSDFDGTISLEDTGCVIMDDKRSIGFEGRKKLEYAFVDGKMSYREAVWKLWDSIGLTWDEAWNEYLDHCRVDPGFHDFHDYCKEKGFPIIIVSSGLDCVVGQVLKNFLGEQAKDIEIIANSSKIEGRKWEIIYRDDTEFGNDKSLALLKVRENADSNTIFAFCGDGLSDISAAKHSDVLFARNGKELANYCEKENIPFIGFDSFSTIHTIIKDLVDGISKLEKDPVSGYCKVIPSA